MFLLKFSVLLLAITLSSLQAQNSSEENIPIPKFNCDDVISPDKIGASSTPNSNPLWLLYGEERKHGFKEGIVRILLTFDASGSANTASILKSSGNKKIDQATINWALCTKIKPGSQSSVIVPVLYRW